ncbi:MAG: hypothetical protein CL678_09780, partial [Bdellovibrionaceae bacterium]|nr:hypothetical protein [Pseudobdellovibrionaceae bacterium]
MSQDQVLHGGQLSHSLPGVKNIIAVSSGKGGVGKSTVSVQLALALQKQGKSVGILDADVFGPSIPTLLGVTEPPRIEKKDDVEFLIPPVAYDLKVMSMGFLIDPDQALIWRGPMIHSALTQLCFQVDWGELDVLVIDMPPGTGDVQLSIAQMVSL